MRAGSIEKRNISPPGRRTVNTVNYSTWNIFTWPASTRRTHRWSFFVNRGCASRDMANCKLFGYSDYLGRRFARGESKKEKIRILDVREGIFCLWVTVRHALLDSWYEGTGTLASGPGRHSIWFGGGNDSNRRIGVLKVIFWAIFYLFLAKMDHFPAHRTEAFRFHRNHFCAVVLESWKTNVWRGCSSWPDEKPCQWTFSMAFFPSVI